MSLNLIGQMFNISGSRGMAATERSKPVYKPRTFDIAYFQNELDCLKPPVTDKYRLSLGTAEMILLSQAHTHNYRDNAYGGGLDALE